MAEKMGSTPVNIEALMGATQARPLSNIKLPFASIDHILMHHAEQRLYGGINPTLVRSAFYASLAGKPKDDEHPTNGPFPTDVGGVAGYIAADGVTAPKPVPDFPDGPLDGPIPTDIRLNY